MEEKSIAGQNSFLIPGAIIVAGVLIAGAVFYTNGGPSQNNNAAVGDAAVRPAVVALDSKKLVDDDPVLGNPDAPVTIVEFADFQCPFCARFEKDAFVGIKEQYIKTGKVKFVYRDFPLTAIHPMAQKSAEASECADEQGKFWEYHDIVYAGQEILSMENLKKWAGEIGLDTMRFAECLDSDKYADEVNKDAADGQAAGVQGTPASFVNGRLVSGAVPFAQFQQIIEEELKKAK